MARSHQALIRIGSIRRKDILVVYVGYHVVCDIKTGINVSVDTTFSECINFIQIMTT